MNGHCIDLISFNLVKCLFFHIFNPGIKFNS